MSIKNKRPTSGGDSVTNLIESLSRRAEAALSQRASPSPEAFAALSPEATQQLVHDLQVHQIELEMQNEELRRTHTALEASRSHYFDFYDLAPVGYCTVTEKGLIREVNLTTCTLLNVTRSQLIKQPISKFIFNDDQGIYYGLRNRLRDSGGSLSCELRLLQRDDTPFWAHLVVSAVQDDERVSELRVVLSDITERKQAEALRLAGDKFRDAILDSMPSQIAVLDETGTIVAVNQTWRNFRLDNSATPGEPASHAAVGTNYLDIYQSVNNNRGADQGATLAHDGILRVIQGRAASFELEYPCHSPTQQRWFNLVVTPLNLDNHAVVVTHTDITYRRQLEQAAKEASDRRYQWLVDELPVGAVMHGPRCEILRSNAKAIELLGLTEHQLLGKTSFDPQWNVIHEDGSPFPGSTHPAPQAIASRQPVRNVVMGVFRPTTQDRVWLLVNAHPQLNPDSSLQQVVVTFGDITEQINARAAMLEMNRDLSQTRQTLRQLLELNEATRENEKRHIAREVHDELGQVLTALGMGLSLALIRHAAHAPELLNELNGMKILLDRAVQAVRNVANRLRPAVLDMGLRTALEWLCQEFTKHGDVECALHGFDELLEIEDSRALVLFRIVQEALTNIRRYAQAGEVVITLEKREAELSVEIRDNGHGFDPVAVAQRGTLGLLGMRERGRALGGRVDVNSAPGQGTTISVLIPLEPNLAKNSP